MQKSIKVDQALNQNFTHRFKSLSKTSIFWLSRNSHNRVKKYNYIPINIFFIVILSAAISEV